MESLRNLIVNFADRNPNRGRYGNFGGDDRGGFDRNGREGSYGQQRDGGGGGGSGGSGGGGGGNERYGNYNRRGNGGGNDRRHSNREFTEKPAGPIVGK